jgi:predicted transcriptional regulator YdeE
MDIGDIVYRHSLNNNTTISTQHQDKVGNWEEKNSTLHVLPTISTDVCINTESQDNDSEIIGSNVTELVHGNDPLMFYWFPPLMFYWFPPLMIYWFLSPFFFD